MENLAQPVERKRGNMPILLQPLDGSMAHTVLDPQGVCGNLLLGHRLPQRII